MRKVKVTGFGPKPYEAAGFEDYAVDDADAPKGAERVWIAETRGEIVSKDTKGAYEVLRVSWPEVPKRFRLDGLVETDAKRKPRREGSASINRAEHGSVFDLIATGAELTAIERAAWMQQYPIAGKPPVPGAEVVEVLTTASRKIGAWIVGQTIYIDGGPNGPAKGQTAALAY